MLKSECDDRSILSASKNATHSGEPYEIRWEFCRQIGSGNK